MKKTTLFFAAIFGIIACTSKTETNEHDHSAHMTESKNTSHRGYLDSLQKGLITEDTLKGSPTRVAMNTVGKSHVHITYQSPGVKERVIWGGLVPYNTVWVTGAHMATSVMIMHPIEIEGKKIEKDTYAIFTIPGENEWTFILNSNYKQHLADNYKESEDLLRLIVVPTETDFTPRLTYNVESVNDTEGIIRISWDKVKIEVPFKSVD